MPKQYTFKTTRSTEWLEDTLDNMPPSERSRFIREAIMEKLGKPNHYLTGVTKKDGNTKTDVTQSVTTITVPVKYMGRLPLNPEVPSIGFEEAEVEFDSKAATDKLRNMWG